MGQFSISLVKKNKKLVDCAYVSVHISHNQTITVIFEFDDADMDTVRKTIKDLKVLFG